MSIDAHMHESCVADGMEEEKIDGTVQYSKSCHFLEYHVLVVFVSLASLQCS